ncbi:hypothetical protein HK102_008413, partial [Quaeritorhiza haematococci]
MACHKRPKETGPRWTFNDIPDLSGKVAIVTGGYTGLGRVTCLELARKNAHVIVAGRNKSKGDPVIEALKKETNNSNIEFGEIDLLSLKSVDKFADSFLAKNIPLHILINNAGVMACPFTLSADGIESQFATNHLGHFRLTQRLLPLLKSSAPSRIVNLSSMVHSDAPSNGIPTTLPAINDTKSYDPWSAYARSKLSNILFTLELDRRLQSEGATTVRANVVHPGVIDTELSRHFLEKYPKWIVKAAYVFKYKTISAEDGAATSLYLATSPEIEEKNIHGQYYIPIATHAETKHKKAKDMDLAKQLWEFSEKLVEEKLGSSASRSAPAASATPAPAESAPSPAEVPAEAPATAAAPAPASESAPAPAEASALAKAPAATVEGAANEGAVDGGEGSADAKPAAVEGEEG